MSPRKAMALISLLGIFVGSYLALYKLGYIGTLACGIGSCETVQMSRWATFIGLPVAVWGVGFYVVMLVLSLIGLQPRFEASRGLSLGLLGLTTWGLIFTAWLNYLEAYVIHAWCQWCLVSAAFVVLLFVLALADWFRLRGATEALGSPAALQ